MKRWTLYTSPHPLSPRQTYLWGCWTISAPTARRRIFFSLFCVQWFHDGSERITLQALTNQNRSGPSQWVSECELYRLKAFKPLDHWTVCESTDSSTTSEVSIVGTKGGGNGVRFNFSVKENQPFKLLTPKGSHWLHLSGDRSQSFPFIQTIVSPSNCITNAHLQWCHSDY